MATIEDIRYTYASLGPVFKASFGKTPDISAGLYNGDLNKSLEQAQKDKHDFVLNKLDINEEDRFLDIGCGEGPMLEAVRKRGGTGIGLTLSPYQVSECKKQNLDARLHSWDDKQTTQLGRFKGISAIESFEYFCRREDYLANLRDLIYTNFFKTSHDLLENGGKLYIQTWTYGENTPWGNRNPIEEDFEKISFEAKDSRFRILAGMNAYIRNFSLPPQGIEFLNNLASPYFNPIESSDGTNDYVLTILASQEQLIRPTYRNIWAHINSWRFYFSDNTRHRLRVRADRENSFLRAFNERIFELQRIFYEKNDHRTPPSTTSELSIPEASLLQ